jgi:hypothetical protein
VLASSVRQGQEGDDARKGGEHVHEHASHRTFRQQVGHDGDDHGARDQHPFRRPPPPFRDYIEAVCHCRARHHGPEETDADGGEERIRQE